MSNREGIERLFQADREGGAMIRSVVSKCRSGEFVCYDTDELVLLGLGGLSDVSGLVGLLLV